MMKITSNNSAVRARARVTSTVRGAVVLGLTGAAMVAGGCETTRTRTTDHRHAGSHRDAVIGLGGYGPDGHGLDRREPDGRGFNGGRQGAASDVVFASPRVQQYYIAISPETMAELTRRDDDLSIFNRAPVSAIENEWPVAARPDITRERTGRTSPFNDRRFIYYELERD